MKLTCPNCHANLEDDAPETERQREVLDYIERFRERNFYQPSYTQIARYLGVRSRATIGKHVKALRRQGYLSVYQKEIAQQKEK